MIAHYRYSAIAHIEQKWHRPLAKLLCQEAPNLQWLQKKDQLSHSPISYYLFFATNPHRPVGLLRLLERELTTTPKKSLLHRVFDPSPPTTQRWLNIHSLGASGHGLVLCPQHENMVVDAVLSIINNKAKSHYHLIQLTVAEDLVFDFPFRANTTTWKRYNLYPKKHKNYATYLQSLSSKLLAKLKKDRLQLQSNPHYQITTGRQLHQLFCPGDTQKTALSQLMRHLALACYQKVTAHFFALCYHHTPLTIAIYQEGVEGQSFGELIFNLDAQFNSTFHHLMLQKIINQFYHSPQAQQLRLFNTPNWPQGLRRDLASLQFDPCRGKTYIIPIRGKKPKLIKPRSRWPQLNHEPRPRN